MAVASRILHCLHETNSGAGSQHLCPAGYISTQWPESQIFAIFGQNLHDFTRLLHTLWSFCDRIDGNCNHHMGGHYLISTWRIQKPCTTTLILTRYMTLHNFNLYYHHASMFLLLLRLHSRPHEPIQFTVRHFLFIFYSKRITTRTLSIDHLVDGPYLDSNPVPYELQDVQLDKNYGLDLKLFCWYEPGEMYYVCMCI